MMMELVVQLVVRRIWIAAENFGSFNTPSRRLVHILEVKTTELEKVLVVFGCIAWVWLVKHGLLLLEKMTVGVVVLNIVPAVALR